MKTAEIKTSASARNLIQAKRHPFFNKEGEHSFFSNSNGVDTAFFSPNIIQPKLTIGQPNDIYEVEADRMADKVVQRLGNSTFDGVMGGVVTGGRHSGGMVQPKCNECEVEEREEKIQTKEDTPYTLSEEKPEIRNKPIFESNAVEEKIQPKSAGGLTLGEPGDKYELEADAMADKVVQKSTEPEHQVEEEDEKAELQTAMDLKAKTELPGKQPEVTADTKSSENTIHTAVSSLADVVPVSSLITTIQPKCESCEKEEELEEDNEHNLHTRLDAGEIPEPPDDLGTIQTKSAGTHRTPSMENRLNSSKGSGSALSAEMQDAMGNAFGANFSNVRVHTGSQAVQMNKELNAQAFTHGNDIYFNDGKYDTRSAKGQHLLAHELTHTVQQGASNHIQKEEFGPNSSQMETTAMQSKLLGYDSVYWLEDKRVKSGPIYRYVELRESASLYDLASYIYGDPFRAELLAAENHLIEDTLQIEGKRVRITGGRLASLSSTARVNAHFKNSPLFPYVSSPAFVLSNMGLTDPLEYVPMEKALGKKLEEDFKKIVSQIDRTPRSFYGLVDSEVIGILDKWGQEKFIPYGHLWRYKDFLNGGIYLELLLGRLYQKSKTFSGVFVDDYTDYYSIMIKEFPNSDKIKSLINKYPTRYSDYKQFLSSDPPSFFDEVIITTVKGIPGGITAATGGFMESLPFGIGEEAGGWLKNQSKIYLRTVNYGDEEMIDQAVDGSSLVGGVFGDAVQMLYGGTLVKVLDAIEVAKNIPDFQYFLEKIDDLKMLKKNIPTLFENKEKILDIALGFERSEALDKLESWASSELAEPKMEMGKKDQKGKKGLIEVIKKIVKIINKIKKVLQFIFEIRKKFLDLLDKFGLALIGIPAFIELFKLLNDPKGNAQKIKGLAKKFTKEVVAKVQEILNNIINEILSRIALLSELIADLSISAKNVADIVTSFALEIISKKVQAVKLLKDLNPVRDLISEHIISKFIPIELLEELNDMLKSFSEFAQPLFTSMKEGVEIVHKKVAAVITEKVLPHITDYFLQPKREPAAHCELGDLSLLHQNIELSKGANLPVNTQRKMEIQFNHSFKDVQVHIGKEAQNANNMLQSKAFTQKNKIYFNKNQYDPNTKEGSKLLAHELTHVVQQTNRGKSDVIQRSIKDVPEKITKKVIEQIEDRIRILRKFSNEKDAAKALTKLSKYLQKHINDILSKEDIDKLRVKFGFDLLEITDHGQSWEISYKYKSPELKKLIQHKRFAKKPLGDSKKDWADIEKGILLDLTGYNNPIRKTMRIDPKFIPIGDKKKRSNKQRCKEGLSPYLDDNQKIELHHTKQNFFSVLDEVSSGHHKADYNDLHVNADNPGYISWRGWIALYDHRIRTLGEIYNLIRQRYWRQRLK